jgi:hypothetical protein
LQCYSLQVTENPNSKPSSFLLTIFPLSLQMPPHPENQNQPHHMAVPYSVLVLHTFNDSQTDYKLVPPTQHH